MHANSILKFLRALLLNGEIKFFFCSCQMTYLSSTLNILRLFPHPKTMNEKEQKDFFNNGETFEKKEDFTRYETFSFALRVYQSFFLLFPF